MVRRVAGAVLVVVGIGLVTVGLASWLGGSSGEDQTEAAPATTMTKPPSTSLATTAPSVTTSPPTTTSSTTSSTSSTSTTTLASSTTTTVADPAGLIHDFLDRFVQALDDDDTGFLLGSLHPKIVEAYGRDLCSGWIEREIVTLEDYQLTGDPVGPTTRRSDTPSGTIEISGTYGAPVSFTFSGRQFDSKAGFAVADGSVYWLGECR